MEDEQKRAGSMSSGASAPPWCWQEDVAPPLDARQYALSPPLRVPSPDVPPRLLTPTYCSRCEKMFATIEAFRRHEAMHRLTAKHFPCVECGKYYRHNAALVIHRRTHTGEKPYGCLECGKRFSARSSLVTHGKSHMTHRCPECGRSFSRSHDLLHHQQQQHRQRKISCEDCGRGFQTEPELHSHRKLHPTEVLFLCSACGRDFTPYCKLLRHQKSHPKLPDALITSPRQPGPTES